MLFALALVGIGVLHFVLGDFVLGRAPAFPESWPGRLGWAWFSGAVVVAAGVAVLLRRGARPTVLAVGLMVLGWALLRHLPLVVADAWFGGTWTRAGKALVFATSAFAVAGLSPAAGRGSSRFSRLDDSRNGLVLLSRVALAAFFLLTGVQHFLHTAFVASLIPAWFPGDPVFWTRFAGVALLAGGVGMLLPPTATVAALLSGLMVFSWFWIVHLPRTMVGVSDRIAVFEALGVSGVALLLAGYLLERGPRRGGLAPPAPPPSGIVAAWLLTAVVDGLFSSVLVAGFYGSTVARLWQYVASTLLGPGALDGGMRTVMVGLAMHAGVALGWTLVFAFVVLRWDWVRRRLARPAGVITVAALYGPAIWLAMSLIVVPLLTGRPPAIGYRWWVQLVGHAFFVALPMVATIRFAMRRAR